MGKKNNIFFTYHTNSWLSPLPFKPMKCKNRSGVSTTTLDNQQQEIL